MCFIKIKIKKMEMKTVNISSKNHENKDFDIPIDLKEIKDLGDLNIKGLNWIVLEQYKNDIFVLKQNNKSLWYIQWKDTMKSILEEIEKKENIKIKTNLKLQWLWISIEHNPQAPVWQKNIDFTRNNLWKYSLNVLAWLYKDSDIDSSLKEDILLNLKNRISDINTSFAQKKEILKLFENTKDYEKLVISILESLKNWWEADEFLHLVWKENLQQAIKDHINVDDDFVEQFYVNYDSSDNVRWYSTECGDNVDKDTCNVFSSYVVALWKTSNNPYFKWNTISKAFDNNLSMFKNQILPVFDYYKKVKKDLLENNVSAKILKEKWLVGVMQSMLDKTNMTGWQKEIWTSLAPLWIAVWAIFGLFKYFKKLWFLKWILWLIGWEFALESTTWNSILWLVNKLTYGGFDMSSLTKKNQKKTKELSDGNKEYQKLLWFPAFTNMILGDDELGDLSSYIEYNTDGSIKNFKVKKYIENLPDTDWRKAFLQKMWEKKVANIFVKWLNQIWIKQDNFDNLKGNKINGIYDIYLDGVSKKKNKVNGASVVSTASVDLSWNANTNVWSISKHWNWGSLNWNTWKKWTWNNINNRNSVDNNGLQSTVIPQTEHNEITKKNIWNSYSADMLKKKEVKIYKFRNNNELSILINKTLENKLWKTLSEKLNKKLKELENLTFFLKLLETYATNNIEKDKWHFLQFNTLFHILDWKDQFDKGTGHILKNYIFDYETDMKSLFLAASSWNKQKLRILLNVFDKVATLDDIIKAISNLHATKINSFNDSDEIKRVKKLIKTWDRVDMLNFFAEEMKTPDYLRSYTLNLIKIKDLDLWKINDKLNTNWLISPWLDKLVDEVYLKIKSWTYFAWKNINPNITKEDIKDIFKKVHKNPWSGAQKIQLLNVLLWWLIMKESEDNILDSVSWKTKKLAQDFYNNSHWRTNLENHAWSSAYKIVMIWAITIATDGLVTEGLLAWWLGEGFLWTVTSIAVRWSIFHLSAWMSSLLLNWQLTEKNVWAVATDLNGYIHSIAYMWVLETFWIIMKGMSKVKPIKTISWKMDASKIWEFVKWVTKLGINMSGLLAIDHFVFDWKFTAEEVANVFIFAVIMWLTWKVGIKKTATWVLKIFNKVVKKNIKPSNSLEVPEWASFTSVEYYINPKTWAKYTKTLNWKWFDSKWKELTESPSDIIKMDTSKITWSDGKKEVLEWASSTPVEYYINPKTWAKYTKTLDWKWVNSKWKELTESPSGIIKMDTESIKNKILEFTNKLKNLEQGKKSLESQIKKLENNKKSSTIIWAEKSYDTDIQNLEKNIIKIDEEIKNLEEWIKKMEEIKIKSVKWWKNDSKTSYKWSVEPPKKVESVKNTKIKEIEVETDIISQKLKLPKWDFSIEFTSSWKNYKVFRENEKLKLEEWWKTIEFENSKKLDEYLKTSWIKSDFIKQEYIEWIKDYTKKIDDKYKTENAAVEETINGEKYMLPKNPTIIKLENWETYKLWKRWDDFYFIKEMKDSSWNKIYYAEKFDDFLNSHPEVVEKFYQNINSLFERVLSKYKNITLKDLFKNNVSKLKIIPKKMWYWTIWDILKEWWKAIKTKWWKDKWKAILKFILTWKAEWTKKDFLINIWINIWILYAIAWLSEFLKGELESETFTSNLWENIIWGILNPLKNLFEKIDKWGIWDVILEYLWFTHSIWIYLWYKVYESHNNNKTTTPLSWTNPWKNN